MTTPCLKRLDADCFRAHPAWAKRAFAYRLVHLLTPKPLTKRLPEALRRALLAPGVVIPPGVDLPWGTITSEGVQFPPGWSPGDPVPPGITIPPGTVFPPGWSPADPPPDAVTVDPGATFPPGWTPGDPFPPGAIPPPTYPPDVDPGETGPTPPIYVQPWEPGPVYPPKAPPPSGFWFYDAFSALDLTTWTKTTTGSATVTAVGGWMEFVVNVNNNVGRLIHTAPTAVPDNCNIYFTLHNTQNSNYIYLTFDTASRSIGIRFRYTDQVQIWDATQWTEHTGIAWKNAPYRWRIEERSGVLNLFRADSNVIVDQAHGTEGTNPGRLTIYSRGRNTTKFDDLKIIAQ